MMDHLICEPPSGDVAILLNLALVDRLDRMIRDAPDHEIDGILRGHRDSQSGISGRQVIVIDEFEPVDKKPRDATAFGYLPSRPHADTNVPVGFIRSRQRKGWSLDEADFSVFREYFSAGDEVFLLVRPEPRGVSNAAFFLRDDDRKLRREPSCPEFPLDRRRLETGGYSLLRGSFGPAQYATKAPTKIPSGAGKTPKAFIGTRRTKRLIYGTVGGVLILTALLGAAFLHYSGQQEGSSNISLTVERRGDTLHLSWDPNASAVEHATSGILWISDGDKRRGLELNQERLQAGSYSYTPESNVVNFRLDLLKVIAQASESVRYVARNTAPGTQPNPPQPKVSPPQTPETEAERAIPRLAVRAQPVVSITTQPFPSSRLRDWMARVPLVRRWQHRDGFVPPRTIKEVVPQVPARLARELPGESHVDLKLTIDTNGTVKEIDLVSGGGDERLAKLGADALRQWRFAPARLRDKPVPCDLLATLNFRNPPPGGLVAQRE